MRESKGDTEEGLEVAKGRGNDVIIISKIKYYYKNLKDNVHFINKKMKQYL